MNSSHPLFVFLLRALAVVVVVLAYSFFLGPYGLPGLGSLKHTVAERSDRVLERIEANAALENRLESLRSDPRALESELRSTHNWVRPGEVTIVLPGGDPSSGDVHHSSSSASYPVPATSPARP